MSRASKGAHLYLRAARKRPNGKADPAIWLIRDGRHEHSTSLRASDIAGAERALKAYIASKYNPAEKRDCDPTSVPIADVIKIYSPHIIATIESAPRQREQIARFSRLLDHLGSLTVGAMTSAVAREYTRQRGTQSGARRELEDLRSAISFAHREGILTNVVRFDLPQKGERAERWLTHEEAARLLWAAWRMRQTWKGRESDRATGKHLARFILVSIYTGTRSGAACAAALQPTIGRPHVDLEQGIFYRRPPGARKSRKTINSTTIRLPPRLLAHMRRWHRLGLSNNAMIEWNGRSVAKIKKSFASACRLAGLPTEGPLKVTPHTLRHTCVTWLLQEGVDFEEVAGFVGMSREMLERVYGHHSPLHQEGAVNALSTTQGRKRRSPRRQFVA